MPRDILFPLEGNDSEFQLTEERHNLLAALPLKDRAPRAVGEERTAIIFSGPPNVGKTTFCSAYVLANISPENLRHIVPVSYDEHILGPETGALFNIGPYAQVYEAQKKIFDQGGQPDHEALAAVYRTYRSDSQRVRSLTLNRAAREGYDLCIDTTAASPGIYKMIEILRQNGYSRIEVISVIAPLPVSVARSEQRLRLVEPEEVYGKRDGAYRTFPGLVQRADSLVLLSNPINGEAPQVALRTEAGAIVEKNQSVIAAISLSTSHDAEFCRNHPVGHAFADKLAESRELFLGAIFAPVSVRTAPTLPLGSADNA